MAPLSLSLALFIAAMAAVVPAMMFTVSVASVVSRRCSAALALSVRGIVSHAPCCVGMCVSGVAGAPLQAGGAQRVQEEALVGAPEGTFQPDKKGG